MASHSARDDRPAQAASVRRVSAVEALREAGLTAFIAFGLLLPLVGFRTITDIRNNLVLTTRWNLLAGLVIFIAVARFLF